MEAEQASGAQRRSTHRVEPSTSAKAPSAASQAAAFIALHRRRHAGRGVVCPVQGGHRVTGTALRHDVARTAFAAAAAGGHAQLQLDVVEAHASAGVPGDFAVRDAIADADDHEEKPLGDDLRCPDIKYEPFSLSIAMWEIGSFFGRKAVSAGGSAALTPDRVRPCGSGIKPFAKVVQR